MNKGYRTLSQPHLDSNHDQLYFNLLFTRWSRRGSCYRALLYCTHVRKRKRNRYWVHLLFILLLAYIWFSFGVAQSVPPKISVTSFNIFFFNTQFAYFSKDKSHNKKGSLHNGKDKTLYIQPFVWHHVCTLIGLLHILAGLALAERGSETMYHYGACYV